MCIIAPSDSVPTSLVLCGHCLKADKLLKKEEYYYPHFPVGSKSLNIEAVRALQAQSGLSGQRLRKKKRLRSVRGTQRGRKTNPNSFVRSLGDKRKTT